jgi:hypothetical protein
LLSFAIVSSDAVNMGMQVSALYPDLHSFGYMLGVALLDHMAILVLVF